MNPEQKLQEAISFHNKGELEKARNIYEDLNAKYPKQPDILNLLGVIYYQNKDLLESKKIITKAIKLNSNNAGFYCNLGVTLNAMGKKDKAIDNFNMAIKKDPKLSQAYTNLGNIHLDNKNYILADEMYYKSYSINKTDLNCLINFALTKFKMQKYTEAEILYKNYLQINPSSSYALNQLSKIYAIMNNIEQAKNYSDKALELSNNDETVIVQAFNLAQQTCDFEFMLEYSKKLDEHLEQHIKNNTKPEESPFINISRSNNLQINYNVAKLWSKYIFNTNIIYNKKNINKYIDKIKIAYLSCDYHAHATAYLIEGLIKSHNRDKFEVVGISYTEPDNSVYYKKLQELFDVYIDIYKLSDADAAKKIKTESIDILIDLKGFTGNSRLELLNYNLAPIVINYLGYPGTMGSDLYNYIIADKTIVECNEDKYYSEKILYMPGSYQCTNVNEKINYKASNKEEAIPEDKIILACFNQPYKITKEIFELWIAILKESENTILWLLDWNKVAKNNLIKISQANSVADRIYFADKKPREQHLARLKLADIMLDTPVYNGHTSTTDALFCGVPVVSIRGQHFASRVSASLLYNCGLMELICETKEQYKNKILELIKDPDYLINIKDKITNKYNLELFNTEKFTKEIEELYIKCFEENLS